MSNSTGLRGGLLDAFNDRKNQQDIIVSEIEARCSITEEDPAVSGLISINNYGVNSQATDGAFAHETSEELATDPTEDNSDDSASDEDLKDLARHGLPSACIFVAKYALSTI